MHGIKGTLNKSEMRGRIIILNFILLSVVCINTKAIGEEDKQVEKIKKFDYLYRYQNLYLGGQPTEEELRWLKAEGVTRIINFRTAEEINEFTDSDFDEKSLVREMGFEYIEIPVGSRKDYSPGKLKAVSRQINENEKILLHCRTADRVTHFFIAYLIKHKGYSINEAVDIGRQIRFFFPLEGLLDIEIDMKQR